MDYTSLVTVKHFRDEKSEFSNVLNSDTIGSSHRLKRGELVAQELFRIASASLVVSEYR